MAYKAFSVTITIGSPAVQIDVTQEGDDTHTGAANFAEVYGQFIEFDVGSTDIYVGGDATVTTSTGRHYVAGTHIEMTLSGTDHLWAVTASGTSVVSGSQLGV
jgi:hypothetical protein